MEPESDRVKPTVSDSLEETYSTTPSTAHSTPTTNHPSSVKRRRRRRKPGEPEDPDDEPKRRVVTTACIACRKRKSKCDGNTPACAACSQVYSTPCIYDPNSDHRRKGVYKRDIDGLKTKESTLQTIVQAILNWPEDEVPDLIHRIRTCESLDDAADEIVAKEHGLSKEEEDEDALETVTTPVSPQEQPNFESKLGTKMGELRLDDGSFRYIGGTSHLLFLNAAGADVGTRLPEQYLQQQDNPITSWTDVTTDPELITHILNMYFTWHYTYFTCVSRSLFYRDFLLGRQPSERARKMQYCSPLLVNAMLALGCHFTGNPAAREDPEDGNTAGNHFFREAKRLIVENDEYEKPKITTIQALALMSVREAGCGREAKGWVYSGMSFRMALDMGLHLDSGALAAGRDRALDEGEEDARRLTFWGCFLFDKCWSNYLGRLPQLPTSLATCPKFDVFPDEDSTQWIPYSDTGAATVHKQAARTRAVALQNAKLCEISGDLMRFFYNPGKVTDTNKQKGRQAELKKLSEIEIRLESWRKSLPKEIEPREGALPHVFIMHMFYQLLFIHLFRPFLQYTAATSPLPSTVSPRKLCTTAAATISRLFRLYKRSYGLRQICNICVYILHNACTIHLLNLPDKDARRDFVHGVKHLEEMAESWPCARRTLTILGKLGKQWKIELPEEATTILVRCKTRFGSLEQLNKDRKQSATLAPPQAIPVLPQQPHLRIHSQPPTTDLFGDDWDQHNDSSSISDVHNDIKARQQPHQLQQRQDLGQAMLSNESMLDLQNDMALDLSPQNIPSTMPQSGSIFSGLSAPSQDPSQSAHVGQSYAFQQPQLNGAMGVPMATNANGSNPGDMFGGVEQLLRDVGGATTDWMLRDQSALAWGFGNWELGQVNPGVWSPSTVDGNHGNAPTNGQAMQEQNPKGGEGANGLGWNSAWQ